MTEVVCPHFVNGLCSIYDTRPSCCRNFPNRNLGMFCADSKCDEDCANCKDKCCTHIVAPSPDLVIAVLSITCSECQNIYCNRDK